MAGTDGVAEAQAYSLRHGQNTLISSYTVNGVIHYPHYWSTYCIHLNHADCRMTCKTCQAPCPVSPESARDRRPGRYGCNQ